MNAFFMSDTSSKSSIWGNEGNMFGKKVSIRIPKNADNINPYDPLQAAMIKTMRHINFGEGDCLFDEETGECDYCVKVDADHPHQVTLMEARRHKELGEGECTFDETTSVCGRCGKFDPKVPVAVVTCVVCEAVVGYRTDVKQPTGCICADCMKQ